MALEESFDVVAAIRDLAQDVETLKAEVEALKGGSAPADQAEDKLARKPVRSQKMA